MEPCFIIDKNIAWIEEPLRRRGFKVYSPKRGLPNTSSDLELLEWARKLGCYVVSHDNRFKDVDQAIHVPIEWNERYNSWELVTRIIKTAALKRKNSFRQTTNT